jgi:hypothetical protein
VGASVPLTSDNAIGPLRAPQVCSRRPLARPSATRRGLSRRQPTNSRQQEPHNKPHQEDRPKTRPTTKTNQDTTTRPMTTKQNQDPQTKPTNKSPNRAGIPMPPGSPPHEIGISPGRSLARMQTSSGRVFQRDFDSLGGKFHCDSEPGRWRLGGAFVSTNRGASGAASGPPAGVTGRRPAPNLSTWALTQPLALPLVVGADPRLSGPVSLTKPLSVQGHNCAVQRQCAPAPDMTEVPPRGRYRGSIGSPGPPGDPTTSLHRPSLAPSIVSVAPPVSQAC